MPSTVTTFYTFSGGTKARANQVNHNFTMLRGKLLPLNDDTQTASNLTHGLGAEDHRWATSYIESIFFGDSSDSWFLTEFTTGSDDLVFRKDSTEKFRIYESHDMTVEATQHLSFLVNGNLTIANSEDGPRIITHGSTIRFARFCLLDGGPTNGVTTIRLNNNGASVQSFNITGTGDGSAITGVETLVAMSIAAGDYVTIDVTARNQGAGDMHMKLY